MLLPLDRTSLSHAHRPSLHNYQGRGRKMLDTMFDDELSDAGGSVKGLILENPDGTFTEGNVPWTI
jgi:hypothetical protein